MLQLSVSILTILVLFMCLYSLYNDDFKQVFMLLLLFLIFAWTSTEVEKEAYKKGQIDALNGEYKYEMQVKQDTVYIDKN